MKTLSNITLLCVDCIDWKRAVRAIRSCTKDFTFGSVKLLTSLDIPWSLPDITIVKIPAINTIQDYSRFMVCDLYKYVDTDFVLTIQWDAFILNPDAWTDEFLNWDFTGSPWWFLEGNNVGNGAFSLRSKKFLLAAHELGLKIKNYHPEDQVLCRIYSNHLITSGIKFAPEELAHKFSFEGNERYGKKWRGQLGYHDNEMSDLSEHHSKTLHKIYRICDKKYPNIKLDYLKMFMNAVNNHYVDNLLVIADNCSQKLVDSIKHIGITNIIETKLGNSESFKECLKYVELLPALDYVYLCEDDYKYKSHKCEELLLEGLTIGDYCSLYDHGDKYIPGFNPLVNRGSENTRVYFAKTTHFRETNSTTMTFAAKVKTLIEDKDILIKHCNESVPKDFPMFLELGRKGRKILTSIPGYSNHMHENELFWAPPASQWGTIEEVLT